MAAGSNHIPKKQVCMYVRMCRNEWGNMVSPCWTSCWKFRKQYTLAIIDLYRQIFWFFTHTHTHNKSDTFIAHLCIAALQLGGVCLLVLGFSILWKVDAAVKATLVVPATLHVFCSAEPSGNMLSGSNPLMICCGTHWEVTPGLWPLHLPRVRFLLSLLCLWKKRKRIVCFVRINILKHQFH